MLHLLHIPHSLVPPGTAFLLIMFLSDISAYIALKCGDLLGTILQYYGFCGESASDMH